MKYSHESAVRGVVDEALSRAICHVSVAPRAHERVQYSRVPASRREVQRRLLHERALAYQVPK